MRTERGREREKDDSTAFSATCSHDESSSTCETRTTDRSAHQKGHQKVSR